MSSFNINPTYHTPLQQSDRSFQCFRLFVDVNYTSIVGFCNCSMFCYVLLYVHSSFAIIWTGKIEMVVLLCLCSWRLVIVVWLILTTPRVCPQFVIVVFPDHTHLLF